MDNPKSTQRPKVEIDKEAPITSDIVRQLIKDTVLKMGPTVPKEQKLELAKVLTKVFEQGMSPREAMKISETELAQLYSYAYQMFTTGKYLEARELFKMLLTLEPGEAGFALSLGACHHHLGHYEHALDAYMLASALTPADPIPLFYAYGCYLNLKDLPAAGVMLSNVVAKAGDTPQYAKLKERAVMLLEGLEKQLALGTQSG